MKRIIPIMLLILAPILIVACVTDNSKAETFLEYFASRPIASVVSPETDYLLLSQNGATYKAHPSQIYPYALSTEVNGSTSATLTIAQMSGTQITNYQQTAPAVLILGSSAPQQGMAFTATVGKMSGVAWKFQAYSTGRINLDGSFLNARQSVMPLSPVLGSSIACRTYRSTLHPAFPYEWLCLSALGSWVIQ